MNQKTIKTAVEYVDKMLRALELRRIDNNMSNKFSSTHIGFDKDAFEYLESIGIIKETYNKVDETIVIDPDKAIEFRRIIYK